METLFAHPAIQSGVAPFIFSLLVAGLFYRFQLVAGLSITVGFAVSVYLATGFAFDPLTSTRKIILLVLLSPIMGVLLCYLNTSSKVILQLFSLIGGLAILWILWPVVSRNPTDMILPVLGYMIYAGWMVNIFIRLSETTSIASGTASMSTGFAVGISALVGSSALLGQMGLSLGAAGAAFLLVQLLANRDSGPGYTISFSSGLIAALVLPAAVVYAKVPWIVLPIVAIVPVIAFYPFEDDESIWKNTISLVAVMAIPIGFAIYLTVQSAGEMTF